MLDSFDPATERTPNAGVPLQGPTLDELEKRYIEAVLSRASSLQEAASVLGIDLSTLWRKRRRYELVIQGYRTHKLPEFNRDTLVSSLAARVHGAGSRRL
jgi:hypothetical protein